MKNIHNNWLPRKALLITLGAIAAALLLLTPKASAYGFDWDISSFDTDITVRTDGSLLVKETIVADYSRESHHGIYRTIPIVYGDATYHTMKLRYNVVSVKDEFGSDWWYETTREGDYVKIKAGDPDVYQNSPTTFVLTYEIQRAISFQFDDHDEIYWNATGDEWDVPILAATATIHFPSEIAADELRATCFTGGYGSTEKACEFAVQGSTASFEATRPLREYEGLTIVGGFPKGIVQKPAFVQQVLWFLTDNWPYFLPLFVFALLYYLWYTRGRDPQSNRDTVMPHYKPPKDISPSEAGTIIDEKVDMHDLSATIIDMAVRGYLKIIETKKKKLFGEDFDYTFEKLKEFENDSTLHEHEKLTMKAIFGGGKKKKLSDLKNKFYKDLPGIREEIYNQLVKKGYFPRSPDKVRTNYYSIGGVLAGGPFFFMGAFIAFEVMALGIALTLCGIIILIFAKYMPAKTKKGVNMYYKVLGLEEYISTAEADRIKFQEKENLFMQLLPYAMAFRIADKWSNAFEGLNKVPDWYQSDDPNIMNFNTIYFISRLNSLSSEMNSAFTSAPRSSGSGGAWSGGSGFSGGFSGGGFGGGGGGSW